MQENQKFPVLGQFFLLLGLFLLLGSLFQFAGVWVAEILFSIDDTRAFRESPEARQANPFAFLFVMGMSAIGQFILPALIVAYVSSGNFSRYYFLDQKMNGTLVLLTLGIGYFMTSVVQLSAEVNRRLNLPDFLEAQAEEIQALYEIILTIDSLERFLLTLVVAAVLPAIGEELIFRGGFQKYIHKWTKNHHIAIWVVAFAFSAIHLQFDLLLPRMILGAMFGYLLVWSGNMWYPVIGHFFNNAMVVTAAYMTHLLALEERPEELPWLAVFTFLVIFAALLYVYWKKAKKEKRIDYEEEIMENGR